MIPKRMHYGWIIVITGAFTLFACLGLARFALGMILPSMGKSLALGYDQMGFLGTANFCGYLAAVALAPWFMRRFGGRATIACALGMLGTCLVLMSQSRWYPLTLGLYFLTGTGTGLSNVPLMVLATQWIAKPLRGRAIGCMSIGTGAGIIASGFLVPAVNLALGAEGWRTSWAILGAVSLGVALMAWKLLRNSPSAMGLSTLGAEKAAPQAAPGASKAPAEGGRGILMRLGLLYFVFGATYMIYGTFIVTAMVKEYGLVEASAGRFWAWVGFFSIFSGPLFGGLSDRIGRKWGLAAVFVVQTSAYALAGSRLGIPALYLSVVLYGLAAWAVPTIMGAAVVDYLGVERAAASFSIITFFFAAGQTLGPALAGMAAEATQTFSTGFLLAAVLTALGAVGASLLAKPGVEH